MDVLPFRKSRYYIVLEFAKVWTSPEFQLEWQMENKE